MRALVSFGDDYDGSGRLARDASRCVVACSDVSTIGRLFGVILRSFRLLFRLECTRYDCGIMVGRTDREICS